MVKKVLIILEHVYRLGGAAVADIAQLLGVKEDDGPKDNQINTAAGIKGLPVMTAQATNQAVMSDNATNKAKSK